MLEMFRHRPLNRIKRSLSNVAAVNLSHTWVLKPRWPTAQSCRPAYGCAVSEVAPKLESKLEPEAEVNADHMAAIEQLFKEALLSEVQENASVKASPASTETIRKKVIDESSPVQNTETSQMLHASAGLETIPNQVIQNSTCLEIASIMCERLHNLWSACLFDTFLL